MRRRQRATNRSAIPCSVDLEPLPEDVPGESLDMLPVPDATEAADEEPVALGGDDLMMPPMRSRLPAGLDWTRRG